MTQIDEESELSSAADAVSLTVTLPRDLVDRLQALADRTTWDVGDFVREALADYIPNEEHELDLTEAAITEVEAGHPGIPHEKMMEWMETWETADELPPPV